MKVALVYDWLDSRGGVERMLQYIYELFPDAHIYTSFYTEQGMSLFPEKKMKPSFMQRFPEFIKKSRILSFPFFPFAFESFTFDEYDLVLSVSSSFAKGVITKPGTHHISITLTPTRYLWVLPQQYTKNGFLHPIQSAIASGTRRWDYIAAQRPDYLLSISKLVQSRVQSFYHRASDVLYPGLDFSYWEKKEQQARKPSLLPTEYFLLVSRFEPYKHVQETIEAFTDFRVPLVLVGTGSQSAKLQKNAGENCIFLNTISDEELAYLYLNAKGLVAAQEEDFGYIALEAAFFGCPVIAYKRSGVSEILEGIENSIVLDSNDPASIRVGLERCLALPYNGRVAERNKNRQKLSRFSKKEFQTQLQTKISSFIESTQQ